VIGRFSVFLSSSLSFVSFPVLLDGAICLLLCPQSAEGQPTSLLFFHVFLCLEYFAIALLFLAFELSIGSGSKSSLYICCSLFYF